MMDRDHSMTGRLGQGSRPTCCVPPRCRGHGRARSNGDLSRGGRAQSSRSPVSGLRSPASGNTTRGPPLSFGSSGYGSRTRPHSGQLFSDSRSAACMSRVRAATSLSSSFTNLRALSWLLAPHSRVLVGRVGDSSFRVVEVIREPYPERQKLIRDPRFRILICRCVYQVMQYFPGEFDGRELSCSRSD